MLYHSMSKIAGNLSQNFERVFLETIYFFRVGVHDISSSNEPIYLKFGVNVLYTFLYRLNYAQIKIFNFIIFKKFGIAKKHAKKETFFLKSRRFVKIYFFDFSKVQTIAASMLIKNPYGLLLQMTRRVEIMHARTSFFLDSSFCQFITLLILNFFG